MLLGEYFEILLQDNFKLSHNGESDYIINNINFSFKKINGKSTIALDWSKND